MPTDLTARAMDWAESGHLPDAVLRLGIRRLLRQRLAELGADQVQTAAHLQREFHRSLRSAPLAPLAHKANEQHYEVPADFFAAVLGPHRKYSACHWPSGVLTLADAEASALAITCERARLADGQQVLELGCGWGSLSLWMAERYPRSRITALSNSHSQRAHIEAEARRRGLGNLQVLTHDFNTFECPGRFDRVVSVEMFEHLRNWPEAFRRVRGWLQPDGRFFLHVFVHGGAPYAFEERDASDWMTRHFFSGGMMPGDDTALAFQDDLRLIDRWRWDGTHYARTARAWLHNMDGARGALAPLFAATYGRDPAARWWQRWRMFFLAVQELFGFEGGQRWWVGHYLFQRRA